MKSRTATIRNIVVVVAAITLISSSIPFDSYSNPTARNDMMNSSEKPINVYLANVLHGPIIITSNNDFSAQGFLGSGSESSPYLIENYSINTTGTCISISNTDAHFIVRKCLLTGGDDGDGILMDNVMNGEISNNSISQKDRPLHLLLSSNNMIVNNTISENRLQVTLHSSTNNEVLENNISDNSGGLYLLSSPNNLVANNSILAGFGTGIILENSPESTLTKNIISNNQGGIYLHSSSRSIITNNTLSENIGYGIILDDSSEVRLSSNILLNNGFGILGNSVEEWKHDISTDNLVNGKPIGYFWDLHGERIDENPYYLMIFANCTNITVENIVFDRSSITLGFSSNCTLNNNTSLESQGFGISFYYSVDNKVTNNRCNSLSLRYSSNNDLFYNTISGTSYVGVNLRVSSYNRIEGNTISGFEDGLWLYEESTHNHVVNNTISESLMYGANLLYWSNNNTFSDNHIDGVHLHEAHSNDFVNNTFSGGDIAGVDMFGSSNIKILNNNISGNSIGMSLKSSWSNEVVSNTIYGNSGGGVFLNSGTHDNLLCLNVFGNNGDADARDNGNGNQWNSTGIGNYWSDYPGTGAYYIPGDAGAIDYHPHGYTDTEPPIISNPADIEYIEGTLGNSITWSLTEDHPSHYVIYRNGILVDSGDWDSDLINTSIDGLNPGAYYFTIVVFDIYNNWSSDEVIVTVLAAEPTSIPTVTTTSTIPSENDIPHPILVVILIAEIGVVMILLVLLSKQQRGL